MATDAEIARWALGSYPCRGDASFLVHGMPHVGASLAGSFLEGMRGHFVARTFVRALQRVISERKGEVSVSVSSQEEANRLWASHASDFLAAMYAAHGEGSKPFEGDFDIVSAWLNNLQG